MKQALAIAVALLLALSPVAASAHTFGPQHTETVVYAPDAGGQIWGSAWSVCDEGVYPVDCHARNRQLRLAAQVRQWDSGSQTWSDWSVVGGEYYFFCRLVDEGGDIYCGDDVTVGFFTITCQSSADFEYRTRGKSAYKDGGSWIWESTFTWSSKVPGTSCD